MGASRQQRLCVVVFLVLLVTTPAHTTRAAPTLSRVRLFSGNHPTVSTTVALFPAPTDGPHATLSCPTFAAKGTEEEREGESVVGMEEWDWPASATDMTHRVHCHAMPGPGGNRTDALGASGGDVAVVCVPGHLVACRPPRGTHANPLVSLATLFREGRAVEEQCAAMVVQWERVEGESARHTAKEGEGEGKEVEGREGEGREGEGKEGDEGRKGQDEVVPQWYHVTTVDPHSIHMCEWGDVVGASPRAPPPRPTPPTAVGLVREAVAVAVRATEWAAAVHSGRALYSELLPSGEGHLPTFIHEVQSEKGEKAFHVSSLPLTALSPLPSLSEGELLRVHKEGDTHDRCVVNRHCTWRDHPVNASADSLPDVVLKHSVVSRFSDGECECGKVYEVDDFQRRALLDTGHLFATPRDHPHHPSAPSVAFLETEGSVSVDLAVRAASEACLAVDMAAETAVMVQEHLETTFVVMLVKLVVIPLVVVLLMPLISKIISAIMPPVINSLRSVFEEFLKPPFEKAMKTKPDPLMGPVNKRNGGEVGDMMNYFQHHRESTMYHLMGLGDFLDLNPFVAIAVWWIADVITDILCSGSQNRITKGMGKMLPMAVKNTVPGVLIDVVVRLQGQEIARRIAHNTVHEVTHGVTHGLTHALSRSVTLSVTHSMEQSRKHYYYCLYCYYTGSYCEFCSTYNEWAQQGNTLRINDHGKTYAKSLAQQPSVPPPLVEPPKPEGGAETPAPGGPAKDEETAGGVDQTDADTGTDAGTDAETGADAGTDTGADQEDEDTAPATDAE